MRLAFALALAAATLLAGVAIAQSVADQAQALESAKREAIIAAQRSKAMERAAVAATAAATRARAEQAAVAARIQAAEADIAAAQARLAVVEEQRRALASRLAARQGPIVRLAGALQIMARRPPALAMVQPGSVGDLVHVRAALGTTLPVVRARTASLRAELTEGERLRDRAARALATLADGQARLKREQLALVRLEAQHRAQSAAYTDSAMFEQDRVVALGEEARDIADLMRELDVEANVRERLASLPGPTLRPPVPGRTALPAPDPAATIRTAAGYKLPVVGRLVTGLGEVSESGARSRGLTLRPIASAQIVAPRAGRIVYAGAFRGYGDIVIVDHGDGWTSLVTGLATLAVRVGERVDRGSPIGRAAAARPLVTVELRNRGRPVDIVPLVSG